MTEWEEKEMREYCEALGYKASLDNDTIDDAERNSDYMEWVMMNTFDNAKKTKNYFQNLGMIG